MRVNLDKLNDNVQYNILLIGRYISQSTFINSFANLLKYDSFDEAMTSGCEEVISTEFKLLNENVRKCTVIRSVNYENKVDIDNNKEYNLARKLCVYSFQHNSKVIRLINAPKMSSFYSDKIRFLKVLENFTMLHAIVVSDEFAKFFYLHYFYLLQTVHKSASANVVFFIDNDLNNKTINSKYFEELQSFISHNTTIKPKPKHNLIIIESRIFYYLVAHRQGYTIIDAQINECRTSWNDASEQIQNMINYVAIVETCECISWANLFRSMLLSDLCLEVIKSANILKLRDLFEKSPNRFQKIEEICEKLWAMVIYSSVVRWNRFKKVIEGFKEDGKNSISTTNFFTKLFILCSNRDSFKSQFSKCSSSNDFNRLFTELQNLKHYSSNFTEKINEITATSNKVKINEIIIRVNPNNSFVIRKFFSEQPQNESNLNVLYSDITLTETSDEPIDSSVSDSSSLSSYHLDDCLFSQSEGEIVAYAKNESLIKTNIYDQSKNSIDNLPDIFDISSQGSSKGSPNSTLDVHLPNSLFPNLKMIDSDSKNQSLEITEYINLEKSQVDGNIELESIIEDISRLFTSQHNSDDTTPSSSPSPNVSDANILDDVQSKFSVKDEVKQNNSIVDNQIEVKIETTNQSNQSVSTSQLKELDETELENTEPNEEKDFIKNKENVDFNELKRILELLMENNQLLVEIKELLKGYTNLSNATLENVVFTCDNSANSMRDFVVNKTTQLNIKQENIEYILQNIDRLIKVHFERLIPVLRNYNRAQPVIENEIKKRAKTSSISQNSQTENNSAPTTSQRKSNIPCPTCKLTPQPPVYATALFIHQATVNDLNNKLNSIVQIVNKTVNIMSNVESKLSNMEDRLSKVENNLSDVQSQLSNNEKRFSQKEKQPKSDSS